MGRAVPVYQYVHKISRGGMMTLAGLILDLIALLLLMFSHGWDSYHKKTNDLYQKSLNKSKSSIDEESMCIDGYWLINK